MRLTAKSEYGLLALIDLACRFGGGPVSAREIAERQAIPPKFLEQLLVSLRRAGLVVATRGAKGGFVLGRDPSCVSVLDVVEALEGPLAPTLCQSDGICHRLAVCAAGSVWERASVALRDVFGGASLADLALRQTAMDMSSDKLGVAGG